MLADCSDSAKLDAQVLLAHVLKQDITYLYTWSEKCLSQNDALLFDTLINRRINGEPVAYLVGFKEFWSLPLNVSTSTLIPRPDTETLIELVLEHHQNAQCKVLDLGTGTGAIALALASENSQWDITAVDFNTDAVALAQSNAKKLNLMQVNILASNWFEALSDTQFDIIVSNPPYIDPEDVHLSQGDVRFEPKSALIAENHGLADIEHIIEHGRKHLVAGGKMYIEHGYDQGEAVRHIFNRLGYVNSSTEKDLAGNDRITWASFQS